ncbi:MULTISPECIES: hypothetical protein [Okeania]|nr:MULTISPECIES: hypothetical protein [Okeania]
MPLAEELTLTLTAISFITFKGEKSNFIKASEYEYVVGNVVEIK